MVYSHCCFYCCFFAQWSGWGLAATDVAHHICAAVTAEALLDTPPPGGEGVNPRSEETSTSEETPRTAPNPGGGDIHLLNHYHSHLLEVSI